jgi:excisionase family DNA binding protein
VRVARIGRGGPLPAGGSIGPVGVVPVDAVDVWSFLLFRILRLPSRWLILGGVTQPNLNSLAIPDDEMTASAAEAAAKLAFYLREHPTQSGRVTLCVPDAPDTTVTVPAEAFRLFIDLLDRLSQGSAVTIAPVDAQLTTQQAAELLNVSRPHLVKLLERGEIPFKKVGTHRRVLLRDVLDYQRRDDARRIKVLRDLTHEAEDLGLYDD